MAGLCRRCYRRQAHSQARFDGNREAVLRRDGYRCRACASTAAVVVHHRHPGRSYARVLLTLCPACHARIHRLARPRAWMPALLLELWREQHRAQPFQLQLEFDGAA